MEGDKEEPTVVIDSGVLVRAAVFSVGKVKPFSRDAPFSCQDGYGLQGRQDRAVRQLSGKYLLLGG